MDISEQDRARVSAAIRAAEARTSGEIVCVLARTATHLTALPIFIAALIALALPWALVAFTEFPVDRILLLQIAVFLLLAVTLSLPSLQVLFLPRAVRRRAAHRLAMEQFLIRGIARKKDRIGILIFVSMAERYARIIADQGIAARVPQTEWQSAVDALIADVRSGHIADGFIAAIAACEKVLAAHFPRSQLSHDELPDRIYLI
jgi:putative membrane protein